MHTEESLEQDKRFFREEVKRLQRMLERYSLIRCVLGVVAAACAVKSSTHPEVGPWWLGWVCAIITALVTALPKLEMDVAKQTVKRQKELKSVIDDLRRLREADRPVIRLVVDDTKADADDEEDSNDSADDADVEGSE